MAAAYVFLTDSGAVKTGPGLLVAVVLTASGAAQISVKDGGASDSEFLGLRLAAAGSICFTPSHPVVFKSGCYVTVDSGTVEVTVIYI